MARRRRKPLSSYRLAATQNNPKTNFEILTEPRSIPYQCNLKPANMRGVKSFAMVLCVRFSHLSPFKKKKFSFYHFVLPPLQQATSKDGKDAGIELIDPPPNSKPGERIYFEGADFESASLSFSFFLAI